MVIVVFHSHYLFFTVFFIRFLIYFNYYLYYCHLASAGSDRFQIPSRITNNLEISNVKLTDSGTFTCRKADEKFQVKEVELIVFEGK